LLACDESCKSTCSDGSNTGCDSCKEGYTQNEDQACVDKNECDEDDICVEGTFCINTKGSYRCQDCDPACEGGCIGTGRLSCNQCKNGWKQIEDGGKGCEDINECEAESNPCATGTYCQNKEGSYECVPCHSACESTQGCTGEGSAQCAACAEGWQMEEGSGCVDVDECESKKIQCSHGEVCVNQYGPDSCLACHESCKECTGTSPDNCLSCNKGYALIDSKCKDIDECTSHPCDKKTENCHNQPGTYKCQCKKGFVRTKAGDCKKKSKNTKTKKKKSKEQGKKEESVTEKNESESNKNADQKKIEL